MAARESRPAGAAKRGARAPSPSPADQLRTQVQRFVRTLGVLASDRTPCGTPISTSHAHALMVLLERGRRRAPATQQELGEALGIDKSNVARLCSKLESEGHVARQRSPADGRARLLALTPSGRSLAARVEVASRRRFAELLAALPAGDTRAVVLASLEALNQAILVTRRQELPR